MSKYNKNEIVLGVVTGIEKYGIFVGLDEYYSGLIHISEISDNFVRNVHNYVNIGETIKVKVLEVDDDTFQVKLSIKNVDYRLNSHKQSPIAETGSGFKILKDNLGKWINDYLDNNNWKFKNNYKIDNILLTLFL